MPATRPASLTPLLLALALVLAAPIGMAILMGSMALLAPQGDRYVPTLDELAIPADWEVVHTEVMDGGFMTQARATRYYFADLEPVDGVSIAKEIARAGGFSDPPRPVVEENCRSTNGGLPTDCVVGAFRLSPSGDDVEHMWINLDRKGTSFTIGSGDDRTAVSDPERALVRITIRAASATGFEQTPGSSAPAE
jgi:hypothetical protein